MTVNVNAPVESKSDNYTGRRALSLLALGACSGVLLGCLSVTGMFGNDRLPNTVVARVNGTDMQMVEYERALRLFGSEKREAITDSDRSLVLERMIQEELLLQQGVNSGLVRRDNDVREEILKSVLTGLTVELEAGDLDKSRDTLLAEYLGQLEAMSSIRWTDAGLRP